MSYIKGREASRDAQDWAAKKKAQMERAKQIREERKASQGMRDPGGVTGKVGSFAPDPSYERSKP